MEPDDLTLGRPGAPEVVWQWLLARAGGDGETALPACREPAAVRLRQLYQHLVRDVPACFVVAHIGQSLDGRIATDDGQSQWVTGREDVIHNHRMRALFDAVVVGAGTVVHDDPRLTVREVEGANPVRVVLDTCRRLGRGYRVFEDGEADTLLLCGDAHRGMGHRHGQAEVIAAPTLKDGRLSCGAVLETLAQQGLKRVFVEGGGVTISRFLEAGCLHRLQIVVAPVLLGSGRPALTLPTLQDLAHALRPRIQRFDLGADTLFECAFDQPPSVDA